MDAGQWKMRLPLLPTLLLTLSTIFLATSQRAFLSKYMSRSKLQRTEMSIFRQVNWIKFWYLYCNEKITTSFIRATFWQKQSRKVLIDPPWASLICLLGWGEHSKPMEISSPGVYNGRGSHHTRHSLNFAYQRKVRGFTEERVLHFCPWWWSLLGDVLVKKLGAALARQNGQVGKRKRRHHLWGRLGILLKRGNAAILGNRHPTHHAPCTCTPPLSGPNYNWFWMYLGCTVLNLTNMLQ